MEEEMQSGRKMRDKEKEEGEENEEKYVEEKEMKKRS